MTSTPQYIKSSVITKKIAELQEERYNLWHASDIAVLDGQIEILKEILKPQ